MPLHHAADKGAPFDVMELLLKTKSEPAAAADKARSSVKILHRPRAVAQHCVPLLLALRPFVLFQSPCHARVLRLAPRTQDERLPLHYAAIKGAPFDVMKLLLDANSEAVNAADKVPRRTQAAPPVLPPRHVPPISVSHRRSRSLCQSPRLPRARTLVCVAQDGWLPLHHAVDESATLEVVKLLLGPESNAATAAAKARRAVPTPSPAPLALNTPACPSPPTRSSSRNCAT